MSYDVELQCPVTGSTLSVDTEHHLTGGTYQVGGSHDLKLNITYNYSKHFYRVMGEDGLRTIYGMTGAESIPLIQTAMDQLSNDVSENYWESTEGNAKIALSKLLAFAKMRPDGVWAGD